MHKIKAEKVVSKFYNGEGWRSYKGNTNDARRWEDLREYSQEYVSRCRKRLLSFIPKQGKRILDMASGPIQYPEYLEYSKNFEKRYCIDLSLKALELARDKIGDHGVFLHGSFFDLDIEDNFFDCSISMHTIYHMDREKQEDAVRKLLRITKQGKPIIIVYSNPKTIISLPNRILRFIKGFIGGKKLGENKPVLYFYAHPISWWFRFSNVASVEILPWRSFAANFQKVIIPNNMFGKILLRFIYTLEKKFPNFFVKNFQYPMVILKKY